MTESVSSFDATGELAALRETFGAWLDGDGADLAKFCGPWENGRARVQAGLGLQQVLYDQGWAAIGWPVAVGGRGGTALHRAVLYEELVKRDLPVGGPLEHLEILAPPVVVHGSRELVAARMPRLLDGSELWCQGFSEPDAGSDLTALRTRANAVSGGFVVNGTKLWTSWAGLARWCVALVRTGSADSRHRGLSLLMIDLSAAGVEVNTILQANGNDELAEVVFTDVFVPDEALIGDLGQGWPIALEILGCERSAFAWMRGAHLHGRLEALLGHLGPTEQSEGLAPEIGQLLVDLFALGCSAASQLGVLAEGRFPGPRAAATKLLLSATEQALYDTAQRALGPDMFLRDQPTAEWREDYLFSRVVSIYGGSRQMQLSTLARFMLAMGPEPALS
jgi:alkylation response protein AidB-like acyl-CoA dehydrogenase